jgi:hypothetical protein
MVKLLLAAYTTPATGPQGFRWIWRSPSLSDSILNSVYSSIKKPSDIARWVSGEIHGGLISADAEWCAIYRFLNAGRDSLGRQGRLFLTAGFLRFNELPQLDLRAALESPVFSTPLDVAPQRAELDLPSVSVRCPKDLLDQLRAHSLIETTGGKRINELTAACAQVGRTTNFNLELNGEPGRIACVLFVSLPVLAEKKEDAKPTASVLPPARSSSGPSGSNRSPFSCLANRFVAAVLVVVVIALLLYARSGSSGNKRVESSAARTPQEMPSAALASRKNKAIKTLTQKGSGTAPKQALADALDRWNTEYGSAPIAAITITPDPSLHWVCQVVGANVQKQISSSTPAERILDRIYNFVWSGEPHITPATSPSSK